MMDGGWIFQESGLRFTRLSSNRLKAQPWKQRHGTPPRRIGRWCSLFLLYGNNTRYIIIYIYINWMYIKKLYIYIHLLYIHCNLTSPTFCLVSNLPERKIHLVPFLSVWKNLRPHHEAAASEVVTPPSRQWNYLPPLEGVTVKGKSVEKTREGSLGNLNLKTSGKLYV